jgi:hypothetical protein
VDESENDPKKRLAELTAQNIQLGGEDEVRSLMPPPPQAPPAAGTTRVTTAPEESGEKETISATQMFECALLAAEDEMDAKAARNVRAEAAAELAEFDESIDLDDLDVVSFC